MFSFYETVIRSVKMTGSGSKFSCVKAMTGRNSFS
jgi:hypothetical protein